MNDTEIVRLVKHLFEPTTSPGEAFDSLFKLRQARVAYTEVFNAILRSGSALDENHDHPAKEFECPGCGIARTERAYCINPACPEHKPNSVTAEIERRTGGTRPDRRLSKFKNPKLGFGPYTGKTLTEVAAINPSYLTQLESGSLEFWREQATLAKLFVEIVAPPSRDTSDTGYFD